MKYGPKGNAAFDRYSPPLGAADLRDRILISPQWLLPLLASVHMTKTQCIMEDKVSVPTDQAKTS